MIAIILSNRKDLLFGKTNIKYSKKKKATENLHYIRVLLNKKN